MDNSITKVFLLAVLTIFLFKTIHSQTLSQQPGTSTTLSQGQLHKKTVERIKWTRQLPATVRKAFYESQYKDWFIENMNIHRHPGKIFYRFYVNNRNLLDGDHYDSFLKYDYLDIYDSIAIIRN